MVYQFCDENSCHTYLVKARNRDGAVKKFLAWQKKALRKSYQWPEEMVKDKKNWMRSDATLIGFGK